MRSLSAVALRGHQYAVLLALLLVSLAVQSFDARPGAEGLLSDVFRTMLGVAMLVVVFERPRERAVMAVIFVATLVIGWWGHLSPAGLDYTLSLALHALMALFLWAAVSVILRDLFRNPVVGAENVLGAICGYIIAGDAWAGVNAATYLLMPAAYGVNPEVSALLGEWHGRLALMSYYSISQMLTLGYADVTPVRAPATTLSLLSGLFGLFYTAVVVSQLVGMAQSRRRETP
jgi:hypothetical protein